MAAATDPATDEDSQFAPYECPICWLFMTAPARHPMVLGCGHTLCEECLRRLSSRQCPMCKTAITHSVHCFLISDLIDRFVSTHKVPLEANPPTIDAPVPLCHGICTCAEHGQNLVRQRWYHCHTCNLVKSLGCCQVCADICHRGHDLVFSGEIDASCCCGAGQAAPCGCRQPGPDLQTQCTILRTGTTYVYQPWFHCVTCGLVGDKGCCQICAVTCHAGHTVVGGEYMVAYCDCGAGDGPPCKCISEKFTPHCTFVETRTTKVAQEMFFCRTCGITGDKYICQHCARTCHAGHIIEQVDMQPIAFCQCGLTCTVKRAVRTDEPQSPSGWRRRERGPRARRLPFGMR
jgi:hypothetical protein